MPQSSLIRITGIVPRNSEEEFDYAIEAGAKFIKLKHNPRSPHAVEAARGFQGVNVHVTEGTMGERRFDMSYTEREGKPDRAMRPLVFHPEGRTRTMLAWLPDTPFNREKLARQECGVSTTESGFVPTSFWFIEDPEVDAWVKERTEELRASAVLAPTHQEIIADLSDELKQKNDELAQLKAKLDAAERRRQATADIVMRQQERDAGLSVEELQSIYDEVYEQNKGVVERLKQKHGDKWESSKDYERVLKPKLEERIALEKEAAGVNSDSSNTDNRGQK